MKLECCKNTFYIIILINALLYTTITIIVSKSTKRKHLIIVYSEIIGSQSMETCKLTIYSKPDIPKSTTVIDVCLLLISWYPSSVPRPFSLNDNLRIKDKIFLYLYDTFKKSHL